MSPLEIIFVVLGIALLVASCFIHSGKEETANTIEFSEEVLEIQKKEVAKMAEQILEEKMEAAVVKADDYLSRISNEKILSVNEFSTQILEKIDSNHKEVVFLYDMLNQKEEEIKEVVQQLEYERRKMKTSAVKATAKEDKPVKNITAPKKQKTEAAKPVAVPEKTPSVATEIEGQTQMDFSTMMQPDLQKEEILKLYKQGKSVLEISKALGMGQGEVKLIIGLYGL